MKKSSGQSGMLLRLLPAELRRELEALEHDRDDDSVSAEDWHRRADRLVARSASLPGPLRDAFNRCVKGLARNEREQERRTGRLVGLAADQDEQATRAAEAELRRKVQSGELPGEAAEDLRRRFGGN
jgi:hypothetical protein